MLGIGRFLGYVPNFGIIILSSTTMYMILMRYVNQSIGNHAHRVSIFIGRKYVKKYVKRHGQIDISKYIAIESTGDESPANIFRIIGNYGHRTIKQISEIDNKLPREEIIDYILDPTILTPAEVEDYHTIRVYNKDRILLLHTCYCGDITDPAIKKEIIERYFLDRFRKLPNIINDLTNPIVTNIPIEVITKFGELEVIR